MTMLRIYIPKFSNCVSLKRNVFTSMKYILPFLFFINAAFAEQWFHSFVPRGRHVNALKFLSPVNILYAGGNEFNDSLQDMWLSHSNGLEWESVNNIGTPPWFKSLAFTDTLTGFVVGYSGTIYKTVNGATFWTKIDPPVTKQFNKIIYVTPQILFIAGGSVPREDTTQTILKSTDGGDHWTVMRDTAGYWLKGIYFSDVNNGVAVGDHGTILRTTDGGINWNKITSPLDRNFNAVRFLNTSVGYIVGGKDDPDSLSTILRTTNGGVTWNILRDDSIGILTDITFSSANTGYITGNKGTLLKTTNAGLNWTKQTLPDVMFYTYFNCVEFKNDNLGMVGGKYGDLYIYTNSSLPSVVTLGSKYIEPTWSTVSGGVNMHGETGTYNFKFSTDSTFTSYNTAFFFNESIKTDTTMLVNVNLTSLIPDTTYYYTIEGTTLAGTTYGDTFSFRTTAPTYTLLTQPPTNVGQTTATFNGFVNKFPTAATLSFDYGVTLLLENNIAATPASINDSLSHIVTANVSGLQPNKTYYYRIKASHSGTIVYGEIQTFFTGSIYQTLQTLPPTGITDSSITVNALIDKFQLPVNITFEYGTTISLGNETSPAFYNDSLQHNISINLFNLTNSTSYFYRVKAVTQFGTFYGNILVAYTGINFTYFNTLEATSITDNSAQLHGLASNLSTTTDISFEYGITTAFGNSIPGNPSPITDTGTYHITANPSGLLPDQIYFYRLKGTRGGAIIYGDTRQFFTGTSEIPNWDFQTLENRHCKRSEELEYNDGWL